MTPAAAGGVGVSVILPTYDERANIAGVIAALGEALGARDYEIIVVDDDSPDRTWEVVEAIAREDARVRLIRRRDARGLTSALNAGIAAARGEAVAWLDCDFQHPVALLPRLLALLDAGYDAALTSRYLAGAGVVAPDAGAAGRAAFIVRLHRSLAGCLNRATSRLLAAPVTDWTSGYLALRRELLAGRPLEGDYGEYYIRLAHRIATGGARFAEIPYTLAARREGYSKTTTSYATLLARGWRYLATVAALRLAPGRARRA